MRPGHGRKARYSSLMTLLSMRFGRMPRLSGWYLSWMCGTPSWPLSRGVAFLQFERHQHRLGCCPGRPPFWFLLGVQIEVQVPWLFTLFLAAENLWGSFWIRTHWREYLPSCNSFRRSLASCHPWQHKTGAWIEGEYLVVLSTWLAKDIFLHRVVSTSMYMEDILYIETVNESL